MNNLEKLAFEYSKIYLKKEIDSIEGMLNTMHLLTDMIVMLEMQLVRLKKDYSDINEYMKRKLNE